MNPTELRLGNFIDYEATTHMITGLGESTCNSKWLGYPEDIYLHSYSELKPIVLTEEWLVKFGFELKAKEFNFWGKNGWHISNTNGSFQKDTGDVIVQEEWYLFIADKPVHMLPKIQYVHQLQNLYFSLTGEELTLKP